MTRLSSCRSCCNAVSDLPWWQPLGKGEQTDLGGTRSPPVLRVKGTMPGSPEERALLDRYAGPLKQFYLGQAQRAMLGAGEQSRGSRQIGDEAQMTYLNQFGQEIVTLEVRPEVARGALEKPEKTCWDWAYLRLTTRNLNLYPSGATSVVFKAVRRVPAPTEAGLHFPDGHVTSYGEYLLTPDGDFLYDAEGNRLGLYCWDGLDPPTLAWAPVSWGPPEGTHDTVEIPIEIEQAGYGDPTDVAIALRVDFRRNPCVPIVVDVYGCLSTNQTILIGYRRPRALGPSFEDVTQTVWDTTSGPFYVYTYEEYDHLGHPTIRGFTVGSPPTEAQILGDNPNLLGFDNSGSFVGTDSADAPLSAYIYASSGPFSSSSVLIPAPEAVQVTNPGGTSYSTVTQYHPASGLLQARQQDLIYTATISWELLDDHNLDYTPLDPGGWYHKGQWIYNYVVRHIEIEYPISPLYGPPPPGVPLEEDTREVELAYNGGWGTPPWTWSYHSRFNVTWSQWEWRDIYPDQIPAAAMAATATVSSVTQNDDDVFVLLGTAIFDPEHKAVTWEPVA